MFDNLSDKLQRVFKNMRGEGRLSAENMESALREVRVALLEADVNFKVVKQFTEAVRERCLGAEVVGRLNPGQQVVAIVNDELTAMMGGESAAVTFSARPPTVILMAGLQGSGKTTAAAKLARLLRIEHHSSVALAACDVHRPAAVQQLMLVGEQAGATVYQQGTERSAPEIARWALERARTDGKSVGGLETLHDQIALFENMPLEAQAAYLLSSLEQAQELPKEVDEMVRAWQHGDTRWFTHEMQSELGDDPQLYQSVLVARNRKWLPKIEALLNDDKNYLVIVGTGHLVGGGSVIDLLKKDGIGAHQL